MDIKLFTEMLKDKHYYELKKMKYKYGDNFSEFMENLKELYYISLPLCDFQEENIVYTENYPNFSTKTMKLLFHEQTENFAVKTAENEIISTCAIENIDLSRESVRSILKGFAPKNEQENRILGIKKGFEFISDIKNKISEENLHKLYMMSVGDFLGDDEKLKKGCLYRHDDVFVVSSRVEHQGLDYKKLPAFMKELIAFINTEDEMNDLVKACIIHFYIAFIHPYFDGNGRIARLLHLWFLIQKGYRSALFIPFSSEIEKNRNAYYNAFTLIEENKKISGKTDVTPMIAFFAENVYNKVYSSAAETDILTLYKQFLASGNVTEKEKKLWQFVLSRYGTDEFSTKQLERDFSSAAYATIRNFVLKFEGEGLLTSQKYSNRVKYRIKSE